MPVDDVPRPWIAPVAHDRKGNPLPNVWGKELIVKYSTGIDSAGRWVCSALFWAGAFC